MSTLPQPADDLEALDRGVRDAGLTAAQAVARIEVLEQQMAALKKFFVLAGFTQDSPPPSGPPCLYLV